MANLNTDLLSPEQAIEATVAAYNGKAAIEKINGLEVSASEINEGTKSLYFKRGQIIEPFTTSDGIAMNQITSWTTILLSDGNDLVFSDGNNLGYGV